MKVEVDKGLCIGCGACAVACSNCFEMQDDGKSHVKAECDETCCDLNEVANDCPVQAITVTK